MEPADETRESLSGVAAQHDALRLLVLFGSRARGDAGPDADWDFGYLADGETWLTFWLDAVDFWCDAGPVIREAYGARLARL